MSQHNRVHGRATPGLDHVLATRFSCRAFLPDQLPRSTVLAILADAQRTPSWCNVQPWHVIVTSGDQTEAFRDTLSRAAADEPIGYDIPPPNRYEGVYRARRRGSGFALYDSVGVRRDDQAGRWRQAMKNFRLFGAPHVAIISSEAALGPYAYVDCGAYISTFLLAAQSRGVATVAQAAIAGHSKAVREHFQIPHDQHIICGISFGLADSDHPANAFRTERATIEEAVDLRGFSDHR